MIRYDVLDQVEGLVSAEAGRKLCDLAADVPQDLAVVEIGSHRGRSTCYLAEGVRVGQGARVYAVDPWEYGPASDFSRPSHRQAFHANLEKLNLSEYVEATQGLSVEVAESWQRPIGLLFVDGWHSLAAIKGDVEAWAPHLVWGGALAIDDYRNRRTPDVTSYVDDVLRTSPEWGDWDLSTPGVRPGSRLAVARKLA